MTSYHDEHENEYDLRHPKPVTDAPTDSLVTALRAIDEEAMYQQPASVHRLINSAASLIESQAIERDRMHAELLTCSCPYPAKGRPSDETVATCTGAKVCGCSLGVAIGYVVPTRAINPNNPSLGDENARG